MISKLSRLLGNISFLEANPRLQICALYKFGLYPPQMVPSAGSRSRYWWVPRVWRLDSGPNLHPEIRHWFAFRPPIHHQASFRFLKECRWQHVQGYRIMSTSIRMVISWENGRPEDPPKKKHAHPGRLRWNTIMEVSNWKMIFLFNWVIFRFHVNIQVCICSWFSSNGTSFSTVWTLRWILFFVPVHMSLLTPKQKHPWWVLATDDNPIHPDSKNLYPLEV